MDNQQIENAVITYSQSLLKIAYTYMKSTADAEDIVQDAFIQYLRSAPEFDNDDHEKAWLIRVTINLCKNSLKSSWRTKRADLDENLMSSLNEDEGFLLSEVLKLPEKFRTVIHLHYYEGYEIKEIAEIIGQNPSTVGVWLKRGRERLKKVLEGDFYE